MAQAPGEIPLEDGGFIRARHADDGNGVHLIIVHPGLGRLEAFLSPYELELLEDFVSELRDEY